MKLNLLGKTELLNAHGLPTRFPTKKILLLLSILAMDPGVGHARGELIQAIWPTSHEEAGRTSLRNALATLRKLLPSNSLVTNGDHLTLVEGIIACDAIVAGNPNLAYRGDFMPGFTEDWVLDNRLRLRTEAVNERMLRASEAAQSGDATMAIRLVEDACRIDPLDQDAAQLRVRILENLGNAPGAAQAANTFHARVLRELGVVVNIETPSVVTESNPLTVTCNWLVERNPEEAASFLVSTRSTWMAMSGKIALECHQKVLDAYAFETPTRSMVSAQRLYLKWIVGEFDSCQLETQRAFSMALSNQEIEAATILGTALSFGYLSQGNFKEAIRYCQIVRQLASQHSTAIELVKADRHLAIIEQHVGKDGVWENRIKSATRIVEENGSPNDTAQQNLTMSLVLIREGKLDQASVCLAQARRYFEASNGRRMVGYCMLTQAMIREEAGDFIQAIAMVDEIRLMGTDVTGHSLATACDDMIARLHGRIGDLDFSAEAVARGTILRRQFGSTPSVYESNRLNPTRRLLKEQLSEQDLRAAYARAKHGVNPVGN